MSVRSEQNGLHEYVVHVVVDLCVTATGDCRVGLGRRPSEAVTFVDYSRRIRHVLVGALDEHHNLAAVAVVLLDFRDDVGKINNARKVLALATNGNVTPDDRAHVSANHVVFLLFRK